MGMKFRGIFLTKDEFLADFSSGFKAGLHLRALRSLFFKQKFHAIGQKKNEAIPLARSDVTIARCFFIT